MSRSLAGGIAVTGKEFCGSHRISCYIGHTVRLLPPEFHMVLRFTGLFFRLLAWGFIASGAGLLFHDLLSLIRENLPFDPAPLGKLWSDWHQESLLLLQPAIERHVAPWLWSDAIQPVLQAPAFVVFLIVGLILWLFTARRRNRKEPEPRDRE